LRLHSFSFSGKFISPQNVTIQTTNKRLCVRACVCKEKVGNQSINQSLLSRREAATEDQN